MLKAATLLVVLAFAGVAAGGGLSSSPAPKHPLHVGALGASFHAVVCTKKRTTHCVKAKKPAVKTRTVTVVRQHTVTQAVTVTQPVTVTVTTTSTVTAAPAAAPIKGGNYLGRTSNGNQIQFVVSGGAGAFSAGSLSIDEVDSSCSSTAYPGETAHLAVYNTSFTGSFPLDANGHFSGTASETWDNGDNLSVTVSGNVGGSGAASGFLSSDGSLHDTDNNTWHCTTGQTTWSATIH